MMFKNSIKLLMANFSTVWKILLYKIIVIGIAVGLFFAGHSVLSTFESYNVFIESLGSFVLNFNISTGMTVILTSLYSVAGQFLFLIADLAINGTGIFVYYIILFSLIIPFMWKLSDIPTGETLYGYMASLTKYSFTANIIRKMGVSSVYALLRLPIMIPINLAIAFGLYGLCSLVTLGGFIALIVPILIFVYLTLTIGIKSAIFSGWMPAIVVFNCNPVKGLKLGFKAVNRRFFKVLSTSIMLSAVIIAINLLFGSFSFLITVPMGAMIMLVFQMVMFFGSQGMRYYVDLDTILSPKKLEETDKFKKVKDII